MTGDDIRPAHRAFWQRQVVDVLARLPREHRALEYAMGTFGEPFDVRRFKQAFNSDDDLDLYNRAQAVERALSRVQNFVAELAELGVRLAGLEPQVKGSPSERAFISLRNAGVIDGALCRRLIRAQRARSRIEHTYVDLTAGEVHRAALLVHDTAQRFVPRFRDWIEPYLPR